MAVFKKIGAVMGVFFFTLLLACNLAFGGNDKIYGEGDLVKETRPISDVNDVHLANQGDLYIEFGNEEKLVIEAQENLLEYIWIELKGGRLTIDTRDGYSLNSKKPIKYYLTIKKLNNVRISSCGDVAVPDIKTENFGVQISSSGDFKAGNLDVSTLDIQISSSGDAMMGMVNADRVDIGISSSGDVGITQLAAEELNVAISSSGNVEIKDGEVKQEMVNISSSGDFAASRVSCQEARVATSSSGDAYVYVTGSLKAATSSSGDIYYAGNPTLKKNESSSGRIIRHK